VDELTAPLCLLFTYDEEVGTLGAKYLVESWPEVVADSGPLPRATVIGEPTGLRAVRLHKGHLKLRFDFTGRSAHSGYPHLGLNAIEAAGRAVVALSRLRHELEEERTAASRHFPEVPFSALNVGVVDGGTAINVVPEHCVLEVGVRVLPGQDSAALARRVEATVTQAAGESEPRVPATAAVLSDSPPLEAPADAPLHRHLCHALGQQEDASVAFATDAGWLQQLGLDCVIWGPGSIEVAHKPDEYVPKADLAAASDQLDELVQHFCVGAGAA
jgi:acetylornithine deacetylase